MMPAMYQETFKSMEKQNVSAMWNDMFIYENILDADGRVIAAANPNGRWPNLGYTKGSVNTQRSTLIYPEICKYVITGSQEICLSVVGEHEAGMRDWIYFPHICMYIH